MIHTDGYISRVMYYGVVCTACMSYGGLCLAEGAAIDTKSVRSPMIESKAGLS